MPGINPPYNKHMDIQARLTEIEIKLSFAESMVDSLNMTVVRQQQEIDMLRTQLRAVYQQIRHLGEADEPGNADLREEVPPHY